MYKSTAKQSSILKISTAIKHLDRIIEVLVDTEVYSQDLQKKIEIVQKELQDELINFIRKS